jgi:hypothetical protein
LARKKPVSFGLVYGNNAEVKAGLAGTEELITEGYQTLYDGQMVSVSR